MLYYIPWKGSDEDDGYSDSDFPISADESKQRFSSAASSASSSSLDSEAMARNKRREKKKEKEAERRLEKIDAQCCFRLVIPTQEIHRFNQLC